MTGNSEILMLIRDAIQRGASDIHLSVGERPMARVDGEIVRCGECLVTEDWLRGSLMALMSERAGERAVESREFDCAIDVASLGRLRANIFHHDRGLAVALRVIPSSVPVLSSLGLPSIVEELARIERGLIVVTGPTGSGKSTTLAAMLDLINSERPCHILTIEDPIEFTHSSKRGVVHQREIGRDTDSFARALRAGLREDPDVILIGEMRDQETIELALTAAETGHVVMATVHSASAPKTIDRILDALPAERQSQARGMLAESLQGVITQTLCRRRGGGRVAAVEVMTATPAVRALIREAKTHQLRGVMEASRQAGMQTLPSHIRQLAASGLLSEETAVEKIGRSRWL